MSGSGPGARIPLEVGDGSAFPTRRRAPNGAGNKKLKKAMFQAALAALSNPTSRTYYDRKPAPHKEHNAAIICLARTPLRSPIRHPPQRDPLPDTARVSGLANHHKDTGAFVAQEPD